MAQNENDERRDGASAADHTEARLTKEQIASLLGEARERGVTSLTKEQIAAVLEAMQRRAVHETVTRTQIIEALELAQKEMQRRQSEARTAQNTRIPGPQQLFTRAGTQASGRQEAHIRGTEPRQPAENGASGAEPQATEAQESDARARQQSVHSAPPVQKQILPQGQPAMPQEQAQVQQGQGRMPQKKLSAQHGQPQTLHTQSPAQQKDSAPAAVRTDPQTPQKSQRKLTKQQVADIVREAHSRGIDGLTREQIAQVLAEVQRLAQTQSISRTQILEALAAAQRAALGLPEAEPEPAEEADEVEQRRAPQTPAAQTSATQQETPAEKTQTIQADGKKSAKKGALHQTQRLSSEEEQQTQPAHRLRKKGSRRLDTTSTITLSQIAIGMQRGANEAAVTEASQTNTLPSRLVYNALGQLLYRIGLQTEYALLRVGRALGRAFHMLGKGLVVLLLAVFRPLGQMIAGIWRDLTAPFVHVAVGLRNMITAVRTAKREGKSAGQTAGAYLSAGILRYRHVGAEALSYLLPLAAAGVLALTVWTLLGREYSLSVTYENQMLGFVESESVWEDAQNLVKSRIKAAAEGEEFTVVPTFHVTQVDVAARSTSSQMADKLISASTDQIQQATGVYVNGSLLGVVTESRKVQQILDTALAAGLEEGNPNVRTEFFNEITQVDGLYFNSSITSMAQLESTLETTNALQLKRIETMTYQEVLPYETVEQPTEKYYEGTKRVLQKGKDGLQEVTADVVTLDGVEIERTVLSSTVLQEATPQTVQVGTKTFSTNITGSITGSGVLIWPVPDFSYVTTRFGQGGHRGMDICGPYGTPIYACDGGTVIESGWHWSWGYYIKIDHGNGMATLYAHCSSLLVPAGTTVGRGQVIALMGSTGNSSGNHCHLEVYVNERLVNPSSYLSGGA